MSNTVGHVLLEITHVAGAILRINFYGGGIAFFYDQNVKRVGLEIYAEPPEGGRQVWLEYIKINGHYTGCYLLEDGYAKYYIQLQPMREQSNLFRGDLMTYDPSDEETLDDPLDI